ncbi:MAG: hypothetical protein ACYSU0_00025 [Planctomycetota bacterium]
MRTDPCRSPVARYHAETAAREEKRKSSRKRWLLAFLFGPVYLLSFVVGYAFSAGSTLTRAGFFQGLTWGTLSLFVIYPIILLFQRGLVFVIGKCRGKPVVGFVVWEYVPCLLISLLFLGTAIIPRSPESYFRRFVADTVPSSVSDIRYHHAKGFGESQWVVIFRIAPEDFDAVLSRYPYEEKQLSPDYEPWIPDGVGDYPKEPMVYRYSHHVPKPRGGGLWVSVYANKDKSLVYLIGTYD